MPGSTDQIQGAVGLPTLELWNGASYDSVAQLINIDPAEQTVGSNDTTNTDITDNTKTSVPGWISPGEYAATFNYLESSLIQLRAVRGDSVVHQWRLAWTDPGVGSTEPNIVFNGYITALKPNMPMEDRWTIDATVTVTGADTFTQGG